MHVVHHNSITWLRHWLSWRSMISFGRAPTLMTDFIKHLLILDELAKHIAWVPWLRLVLGEASYTDAIPSMDISARLCDQLLLGFWGNRGQMFSVSLGCMSCAWCGTVFHHGFFIVHRFVFWVAQGNNFTPWANITIRPWSKNISMERTLYCYSYS